jgi:hypothetical protein
MFNFAGWFIRVEMSVFGTTLAVSPDEQFLDDETVLYHTPSRDPLCVAALLHMEFDLRLPQELEALAGLIDAHVA